MEFRFEIMLRPAAMHEACVSVCNSLTLLQCSQGPANILLNRVALHVARLCNSLTVLAMLMNQHSQRPARLESQLIIYVDIVT